MYKLYYVYCDSVSVFYFHISLQLVIEQLSVHSEPRSHWGLSWVHFLITSPPFLHNGGVTTKSAWSQWRSWNDTSSKCEAWWKAGGSSHPWQPKLSRSQTTLNTFRWCGSWNVAHVHYSNVGIATWVLPFFPLSHFSEGAWTVLLLWKNWTRVVILFSTSGVFGVLTQQGLPLQL